MAKPLVKTEDDMLANLVQKQKFYTFYMDI